MPLRRDFLKMGLLGGAGLLLNPKISKADSPTTTPFTRPLPIPRILAPVAIDATTDYYDITMQTAQVEIIPGLQTTIWGYNGTTPGPTIKARRGRRVIVRQRNNLPEGVSVHLHGGHVASSSDGGPMDLIATGSFKDYEYANNQLPATLWYHDHAMDNTGPHVYKGLAGCYIITDDYEDSLPLPKGANDIPLVIQDKQFNSDGSLFYSAGAPSHGGFTGDRILVNGAIQPFLNVERRKMRFRILNGSNARPYNLALSNSQPIIQIGSDGGLLSAPVSRTNIPLTPGERADVIIDFAQSAPGTSIVLRNLYGLDTTADVMRFDVMIKRKAKWGIDEASIPSSFLMVDRIPAASAARTRDFNLTMQMGGGGMMWTLNGLGFDPDRIDATPSLDDIEIWRFINQTSMDHPMHLHLVMFQILDINGNQPSAANLGWKDTVNVQAGTTVRVIAKFTDYRGVYTFHCHNLEHEDHSMMSQFQVV